MILLFFQVSVINLWDLEEYKETGVGYFEDVCIIKIVLTNFISKQKRV